MVGEYKRGPWYVSQLTFNTDVVWCTSRRSINQYCI